MPVQRLKEFLDREGVKYVSILHSAAYTAQEVAQTAHISGDEMAKCVMIKIDGKVAMAVLPASYQVDFGLLREAIGADHVTLAHEREFSDMFPQCELGAMPPFGNLYGMPVYVAKRLTEDETIAFNAGTHRELIRLSYAEYSRLVQPTVLTFSVHE
ncbi:MAG: YbaK/EbsC family protein [Bacteroidetes bacterium]|nr:YbaK/EbsC family protein [Bacteroidota bacterium]